MKLELVDPACLALVGCWVLLVQLLSALRVPEMIRRLLMTPDAQAEQIRLRARDLQEQIDELQRLCEQINSVDTFVEYAKARRQINKFQAELGRLPKPAAPEGGVDSPAINKLLAIGFEINRDRFVLSNGHACALLYSMLHLSGYDLSLDDLKQFRQLHSKTPGHPESHITPGVEVTTGPLGQGLANGVGMAIAEAHLAAVYNKEGFQLFDNFTYVFTGDGCLQEGVAAEAASLAGHLGLGKLIVIYDDNQITIDGKTSLSFTEDVAKRFEAYGWHTLAVENADNAFDAMAAAIDAAKAVQDKPSIIGIRTVIGWGSAKAGTADVHGSPLGDAGVVKLKETLLPGVDPKERFVIPEAVAQAYSVFKTRGEQYQQDWDRSFTAYAEAHPELAAQLQRQLKGELPRDWQAKLPAYVAGQSKANATRNLSGEVLNALAPALPELVGGSADLSPSNKTELACTGDFQKETPAGRYLRFGVREHAMAAIGNGLAAYGCLIPFTATFLNFIEYCFPAVRLSALSEIRQLYIMTHDSIGLGEDGPTHQPVEAIALCRATPNLLLWRPADGNETSSAYAVALESAKTPSVFCLSRQNLPHLRNSGLEQVRKGAYVVQQGEEAEEKAPELVFIATGSEVGLALDAAQKLQGQKTIRVVSMPCAELFDQQPVAYRRQVLPPGVPVVSIEAAATQGWQRYAHLNIGMTSFGTSAPGEVAFEYFGFTPDAVVAKTAAWLEDSQAQIKEMGLPAGFSALPVHF